MGFALQHIGEPVHLSDPFGGYVYVIMAVVTILMMVHDLSVADYVEPGCRHYDIATSASSGDELARSMAWFPIVGAVQGAILVALDLVLAPVLPVSVVSGLLVAALLATNFGFHLDGFADTLDGLAGGKTRERSLEIMRKGDIGPIGVAGIVIILLIKYASIAALAGDMRIVILFLFPVMGRFAVVPMSCWSPGAREEGLGSAFTANSNKTLLIALALLLVFAVPLMGLNAIIIVALLLLSIFLLTRYFKRRLGRTLTDIPGAIDNLLVL